MQGSGDEERGMQVGSMNEESHVRGCCNITLLQPVRKQCKLSSNRITTHTRAGTSKTNQNKKEEKRCFWSLYAKEHWGREVEAC